MGDHRANAKAQATLVVSIAEAFSDPGAVPGASTIDKSSNDVARQHSNATTSEVVKCFYKFGPHVPFCGSSRLVGVCRKPDEG